MKEYILFGAGYEGRRLLNILGKESVECFCDNIKNGQIIEDIPVIGFSELCDRAGDFKVVIAVQKPKYVDEIKHQLEREKICYIEMPKLIEYLGYDKSEMKYDGELYFWKEAMKKNKRKETDAYYRKFMISLANEVTDDFTKGKVLADFGCGPRGTLTWAYKAEFRLGIDVLVPKYFNEFGDEMIGHNMIYVTSTEKYIPIPDNKVDCLITMNSLDHVDSLHDMCSELLRIMKPGGVLLGSFNLYEPRTECEPQTLDEYKLKDTLLKNMEVESLKYAYMDEDAPYKRMFDGNYVDKPDGKCPCVMWVKARKK